MSDSIVVHASENQPVVFTQQELGWLPWLDPVAEDELTERHWAGLVDRSRAKSAYFRLLVRDPEILEARTKTDKDIFYNIADGLPRAERELAAAATSRYNGCIYCTSVHARFATVHSKRRDDIQRLLDQGVGADLGKRWNAARQSLGRTCLDAHRVRPGAYRRAAQRGTGGRRDRGRDQRRSVLQLGEQVDAFSRRAFDRGRRLIASNSPSSPLQLSRCPQPEYKT